MVVLVLIESYLFIPLSMTLTTFQGHSNAKQFKLEMISSYPIKLKLCRIVKYVIIRLTNCKIFSYTHQSMGGASVPLKTSTLTSQSLHEASCEPPFKILPLVHHSL